MPECELVNGPLKGKRMQIESASLVLTVPGNTPNSPAYTYKLLGIQIRGNIALYKFVE
jgi:hypothetical protein